MWTIHFCLILLFSYALADTEQLEPSTRDHEIPTLIIHATEGDVSKVQRNIRRSIPPQNFPGFGFSNFGSNFGTSLYNPSLLNNWNPNLRNTGMFGTSGINFPSWNSNWNNQYSATNNPGFQYNLGNLDSTNWQMLNNPSLYSRGTSAYPIQNPFMDYNTDYNNSGFWNRPYNTYSSFTNSASNFVNGQPFLASSQPFLANGQNYLSNGQYLANTNSFPNNGLLNNGSGFKRSPPDPQSPYYIQLLPGETTDSEQEETTSSSKKRNTSRIRSTNSSQIPAKTSTSD